MNDLLIRIVQIAIGIGQHKRPQGLSGGFEVYNRCLLCKPGLDYVSIAHRVAKILLPCLKLDIQRDQWHEIGLPEEMIEDSEMFGQFHYLMWSRGVQPLLLHLLQVYVH